MIFKNISPYLRLIADQNQEPIEIMYISILLSSIITNKVHGISYDYFYQFLCREMQFYVVKYNKGCQTHLTSLNLFFLFIRQ